MTYTTNEMMTVAAARALPNNITCFVGIGLPSAACNLAKAMQASDAVLIYESGTIGANPTTLPLSIGDEELVDTADAVVSVPDIFRYWLQGGRIDMGFLGAAQVDRFGNINSTVIGSYENIKVRLPGSGGASEIATLAKEVLIVVKQSKRSFVKELDFLTSSGSINPETIKNSANNVGIGAQAIITDLGIMTPSSPSKEFELVKTYPGVTIDQVKENTGWDLKIAEKVTEELSPTQKELTILRNLSRTFS